MSTRPPGIRIDDRTSWRPVIHDPRNRENRERLRILFEDPSLTIHDAIEEQLDELVATLNPARPSSIADRKELVREHLGDCAPRDYGRWVLYPWSRRLVHLLPPDEYFALRTNRNHYKITPVEQRVLRAKTVGIVGLSVGQATALTLAMEGVGGHFRLADFDVLGLSNMNRLRAGAHNIGVAKVILAAREIFELDPYVDVEIFPNGLEEGGLEAFFHGPPRMDLLVEECDDLMMKIRAREYARANRIPVIMETSDRGMIDIERFDREPERPLLHGLIGELRAEDVRAMSMMDKIPYVMRILDDSQVSTGLAASIVEVKHSISTWPQLASAVALGGALVTDAVRRIFLGSLEGSGRFYVDLETLVGPTAAVAVKAPAVPVEATARPLARAISRPAPGAGTELSEDEVQYLVYHATMAPSRSNEQPWRFVWTGAELLAYLDLADGSPALDIARSEGHFALGAAAKNLSLAAEALGLRATTSPSRLRPDDALVFSTRFERVAGMKPTELFASVTERCTNRRIAPVRKRLADDERAGLLNAARDEGVSLTLIEDDARLAEIAALIGRAERLRYLTPSLHRAHTSVLRWSAREVEETRTGVDVATLDLDATRLTLLRLAARPDAMDTVRRVGGGKGLALTASAEISTSSAVGIIRSNAIGPAAFFEGGRAFETVWLRATAEGLALQPYDLFSLVRHLAKADPAAAATLTVDCGRLFGPTVGTDLILFRVLPLAAPSSRSARKPVESVLLFAPSGGPSTSSVAPPA